MISCPICNKEHNKPKFCSRICNIKFQNKIRTTKPGWKEHQKNKRTKLKLLQPNKFYSWKTDYRLRENKCSVCNSKEQLEYHHEDYITKKGKTLCRNCHHNVHKSSS